MFVHGSAATPKEIYKDRKITAYENGGNFHFFYRFGSGIIDTYKCHLLSQNVRYSCGTMASLTTGKGQFLSRGLPLCCRRSLLGSAWITANLISWLPVANYSKAQKDFTLPCFLPFLGDDVQNWECQHVPTPSKLRFNWMRLKKRQFVWAGWMCLWHMFFLSSFNRKSDQSWPFLCWVAQLDPATRRKWGYQMWTSHSLEIHEPQEWNERPSFALHPGLSENGGYGWWTWWFHMIDFNPKLNSFSRRYVKIQDVLKSKNCLKVCRSGLIQSPFGRLSTAPRHRLWSSKKGLTAWHEFGQWLSHVRNRHVYAPYLGIIVTIHFEWACDFGMIYFFGTTFKLPHVATFGSQLLRESLEPHETCWSSGRLINRKPQGLCLKIKHILGKNHENSPSLGNL